MAHIEQRKFCEKIKGKYPNFFKNKKVLDIGSLDINGSNRDLFENCMYIGLDLGEGKNVDVVSVGRLYDAPDGYFDTIISTEVFEHDMFYEKTITNIMRMLKPGGLFLFTCATTGRPEHGTRNSDYPMIDAPFLIKMSEEWADYYKNLTEEDIRKTPSFNLTFPDGCFELNKFDLYFYGIKGGAKYLVEHIIPEYSKTEFADDIFVIDSWPDNEAKENDLLNCIKRLKVYGVPILLSGHYPIKPEIQKMVDYYLYDRNNPLLMKEQFNSYRVNSVRWSDMEDSRVENTHEFHHDYAIWETMRNSFNFCKYLGKKYIHFMEYDNLPDVYQYRQAFIENIRRFDAVLYEYHEKSSIDSHLDPYIGTYIFSIRTDIAIKVIDLIKTKEEFFINKPRGWQLERNFLECLKKITPRTYVCPYISNNNELNTQAVWNRDGMQRSGANIQLYLAVDDNNDIYLHTISGNHRNDATKDYLIEVTYQNYKKFHNITKGSFLVHNLGRYQKGYSVKCYYQGIEIFNEFLGEEINRYRELNKLTKKTKDMIKPPQININFIDGPFAEIINSIEKTYRVQFINTKNNKIEYNIDLKNNRWAKSNLKYCIDWIIKIKDINSDFYYEHQFNLTDKRVLIGFESNSLGDTLAWIPYVEKFRIDKKCKVICSTFHNNLFINQYPHIEFVKPGVTVHDLYGLYRIGVFYNLDKWDNTKHLTDPKTLPLTKIASEILGLDYVELKPKLPILSTEKKKLVSIGLHATAQAKYWNNPNGWQEVVDFLIEKGYEVRLLSKEEDGYMGNWKPKGVTKKNTPTTESALKVIQESELFIGVSSGLAWLAWGAGVETILISGFTNDDIEPKNGIRRIINKDVCHGCWSHYIFDKSDWNWCPLKKGTDGQFECSRTITSEQVISEIKLALGL